MAHFAAAEVLRCCWEEAVEEEDPVTPALGGAGIDYKARCCYCCCWLQRGLLVSHGHLFVGLLPSFG